MIAALATLTFLATLWLLAVVGATVLEESGGKIAAALKGQSSAQPAALPAYTSRLRARPRVRTPLRAQPRLRDAA